MNIHLIALSFFSIVILVIGLVIALVHSIGIFAGGGAVVILVLVALSYCFALNYKEFHDE